MTKEVTVVQMPKLSKELKTRLANKLMDKNDDKIIEFMQQRQSHIEAIKRLDKEIGDLTTLVGFE